MAPKYTNKNGKTVAGSAAWAHEISQNGGWDAHHEKILTEGINNYVVDVVLPKLSRLSVNQDLPVE
ncbi:hypothetical protein PL11201_530046 [Planktothrix sp. PCC 11201]|uniref:hypothetical protein n=1 Tax=Planktothrix sp. PCC 11201 TaxID=1729650 RepID=UPI00091C7E24|nr:hypothetical protein [Planktothrix sp. PCC 11201]SKB13716.1 hypothetical protein PL11201_530046 [Planktothrix sp. PCC 11201]